MDVLIRLFMKYYQLYWGCCKCCASGRSSGWLSTMTNLFVQLVINKEIDTSYTLLRLQRAIRCEFEFFPKSIGE